MYRYGDGTPFPVQDNFIDTLLAAIDACVGTFSAAADLDDRREKAKAQRKEIDDELKRFAVMDKSVEAALAPGRPSNDRTATVSQQAAARALAAARGALQQTKVQLEQRLQQLQGEPRLDRTLEQTRHALAAFFEHHQLPDTAWRWSWSAVDQVRGDAMALAGRFRARFNLDLRGPWASVPRVGSLVPHLEAVVSKKGMFGGNRRATVSLDRAGVVEVERSPERWVVTIREHATKPSPGWRIMVRDPERGGTTMTPVDATLRVVGDEILLEGAEATPFVQLWEAVNDAMIEMVREHRLLRELRVGDVSVDTIQDPAMIGRTLLGVLGPIVRQIRARSRVPGELAIKRDIGDGRREELYVPRADVERRFAVLPPLYRKPFEEIGLGRAGTEDLEGAEDHVEPQTRPEPLKMSQMVQRTQQAELDEHTPAPMPGSAAPPPASVTTVDVSDKATASAQPPAPPRPPRLPGLPRSLRAASAA